MSKGYWTESYSYVFKKSVGLKCVEKSMIVNVYNRDARTLSRWRKMFKGVADSHVTLLK